MVNLKNLNYTEMIIRFRRFQPMQQAAIAPQVAPVAAAKEPAASKMGAETI